MYTDKARIWSPEGRIFGAQLVRVVLEWTGLCTRPFEVAADGRSELSWAGALGTEAKQEPCVSDVVFANGWGE